MCVYGGAGRRGRTRLRRADKTHDNAPPTQDAQNEWDQTFRQKSQAAFLNPLDRRPIPDFESQFEGASALTTLAAENASAGASSVETAGSAVAGSETTVVPSPVEQHPAPRRQRPAAADIERQQPEVELPEVEMLKEELEVDDPPRPIALAAAEIGQL